MRWSFVLIAFIVTVAQARGETCEGPPALTSTAAQGDAVVRAALGYWFAEEGRTDCAIVAHQRSLHLDPTSFDTRYNLGVALLYSGDCDGAARELRAASDLESKNAQVWMAWGSVQLECGQPQQAVPALRTALERGAAPEPALNELAKAQNQLGRRADAIASLEELLVLEPDSV